MRPQNYTTEDLRKPTPIFSTPKDNSFGQGKMVFEEIILETKIATNFVFVLNFLFEICIWYKWLFIGNAMKYPLKNQIGWTSCPKMCF